MQNARDALTPDTLAMLQKISDTGSFAAAARQLGLVPSALTYRVRQIEDALDVLLFDRSARQARPTEAGAELLREGARLLEDIDAVAHRVRRVATGWEPQLTLSVDGIIAPHTVLELVDAFYALGAPTRLKVRDGIMTGTLQALTSGQADLALGVTLEPASAANLRAKPLGQVRFVYALAPTHPLARVPEPLSDSDLLKHRAIVVADSAPGSASLSFGLLAGQEALTVASLQAKLDAHLRGLGVGFLPEPLARSSLASGQLVARRVERSTRTATLHYAWPAQAAPGKALSWWLHQLERPVTRRALLDGPASV